MRRPATDTDPVSRPPVKRGTSPLMARRNVDFPEPVLHHRGTARPRRRPGRYPTASVARPRIGEADLVEAHDRGGARDHLRASGASAGGPRTATRPRRPLRRRPGRPGGFEAGGATKAGGRKRRPTAAAPPRCPPPPRAAGSARSAGRPAGSGPRDHQAAEPRRSSPRARPARRGHDALGEPPQIRRGSGCAPPVVRRRTGWPPGPPAPARAA